MLHTKFGLLLLILKATKLNTYTYAYENIVELYTLHKLFLSPCEDERKSWRSEVKKHNKKSTKSLVVAPLPHV